jgi:hypothetical protein
MDIREDENGDLRMYHSRDCEKESRWIRLVMPKSGSSKIFVNLELDLGFGSGKCLNLGPDHRFRSSAGLNL